MSLSITAILLTRDEERNLPAALESVAGWCDKVFVVDSGSSDRTAEIARAAGAEVVLHPFETHAKQWNWALRNLPVRTEWVLALDADQRISPGLREELARVLPEAPREVAGYYLPRKQLFRGRWIRHGGYWPKYLLKLFRAGRARCDERELLDFRFYVQGETRRLTRPLIEENLKENEILFWLGKHLRFVELLAQEELSRRENPSAWLVPPALRGTPDQQTLWLKSLWYRLPLGVRPALYFFYRYFLQTGFLDGKEGSLFHFLQAFWFRWMVDVRLEELLRGSRERRPA